MVKDRISGTVVMSAEEAESSRKGLRTLDKLYNMAINGLPTSKPADKLGMEYLQKYNGDQKKAADVLIRNQVTKCTTTGFLTGLGGFITLPITIPADLASSMYIQVRMIAAIAYIGGYSLHDDAVKTMIYATLLRIDLGNVLKQVGVKAANKAALAGLKKLPGKVLVAVNQKLGFRFITKFGQKGIINLGKGIPCVGGILNGGINLAETKIIAKDAVKAFLTPATINYIH